MTGPKCVERLTNTASSCRIRGRNRNTDLMRSATIALSSERSRIVHVLVLGSGVIGTTIAYYAARDGHTVTVVDRQPVRDWRRLCECRESRRLLGALAGPGVPLKAIKWLLMRHRPRGDQADSRSGDVAWAFAMLRNCTTARYHTNKARGKLAEYSRDCSGPARAKRYRLRPTARGNPAAVPAQKHSTASAKMSRCSSVRRFHSSTDRANHYPRARARARERQIRRGLRLPGDRTGDCLTFTQNLAKLAQQHV